MEQKYLRNAMIFGTLSLIWTVSSGSLFGIVSSILCWVAYSTKRRETASAASVFFVISAVISMLFLAVVLFFTRGMDELMTMRIIYSLLWAVGTVFYILSAVYSRKAAKLIAESGRERNGLFE